MQAHVLIKGRILSFKRRFAQQDEVGRFGAYEVTGPISRDNDDPTAVATMDFMAKAGLARERTVTWNVVPWWNGTTKVTPTELRQGTACVRDLLTLLPAARAVVLVGRKAARAHHLLPKEVKVFTSDHPSPKVRAIYPARWNAIPVEWARARAFLDA